LASQEQTEASNALKGFLKQQAAGAVLIGVKAQSGRRPAVGVGGRGRQQQAAG